MTNRVAAAKAACKSQPEPLKGKMTHPHLTPGLGFFQRRRKGMVMSWVEWPRCPPESHAGHNGFLLPHLAVMISTQRKFKLGKLQFHCQAAWKTGKRSFASCQAIAHFCCEFFSFGKCWRHRVLGTDLCLSSGRSNKHRIKTTNIYFSQFWRLGRTRSRCRQISCLLKTFFLVRKWLPYCCVFPRQRASSGLFFF